MKILIVSQYYNPEQFQINEIAPELVRRGHEVTVLTGLPNYPAGEIFAGYEKEERRDEVIDGVRVLRVEEHPRRRGAVNLIRNYVSFARNGTKAAKRLPSGFDLVICYQLSPVTMALPAVEYAKKNKVPLLLYCLDIWPESAKAHVNPKGLIYRYICSLSKKIYRKCDYISVTSNPFIGYLEKVNGVPRDRMSYIPQHADGSMLDIDMSATGNGVADFMYAGNLGMGQRVDVIIRAAAKLRGRDDFMIHIVGDGSCAEELKKLASDEGISDRVIFYGNKSRAEMPDIYRKADALVITLRGNNFVGNTMPGKLQTYMTTGKPIFGAINGAVNEVINEARCGGRAAAEDADGLSELMRDYIENPAKYSSCGDNAKAYFKRNFTLDAYMERLETAINKLTAGGENF